MNKKVKFLSSTLSALLLTSGIALTNVHAQSLSNNSIAKTNSMYTVNSSNKGYDYNVSKDGYDNIHVTVAPEDYEYHNYTVNVSFLDKNRARVGQVSNTGHALKYVHVFAAQQNWVTAEVWIYADGNLIADQVVQK